MHYESGMEAFALRPLPHLTPEVTKITNGTKASNEMSGAFIRSRKAHENNGKQDIMTANKHNILARESRRLEEKTFLGRRGVRHYAYDRILSLAICVLILACLPVSPRVLASATTLDSVVASVGNTAITASDVEKEYRFERFLDAQWPPPPPDAAALDAVRQRLTYQMLLTQEENPEPAAKEASEKAAAQLLAALRKEFTRAGAFAAAMNDLGMTEPEVLARITQQELMLRLINERLRPEASPTEEDVANYYRAVFVPEFQKENGKAAAPPLAVVADQIREVLTQKRINELLDQWIDELRPASQMRFHDFR